MLRHRYLELRAGNSVSINQHQFLSTFDTYRQGCRDISRYAIYRDIFYTSRYAIYRDIFLVISRYKCTWIYGDRRKNRRRKTEIYEQSFSRYNLCWATHARTFEFSCGAAYMYTANNPPPLKFSRPCKYLNV